MKKILSATLKNSNKETPVCCAMVMPHLILARKGTEDDASKNKTTAKTVRPRDEVGNRFRASWSKNMQERTIRNKARFGQKD